MSVKIDFPDLRILPEQKHFFIKLLYAHKDRFYEKLREAINHSDSTELFISLNMFKMHSNFQEIFNQWMSDQKDLCTYQKNYSREEFERIFKKAYTFPMYEMLEKVVEEMEAKYTLTQGETIQQAKDMLEVKQKQVKSFKDKLDEYKTKLADFQKEVHGSGDVLKDKTNNIVNNLEKQIEEYNSRYEECNNDILFQQDRISILTHCQEKNFNLNGPPLFFRKKKDSNTFEVGMYGRILFEVSYEKYTNNEKRTLHELDTYFVLDSGKNENFYSKNLDSNCIVKFHVFGNHSRNDDVDRFFKIKSCMRCGGKC